jgi:hypothetical protein
MVREIVTRLAWLGPTCTCHPISSSSSELISDGLYGLRLSPGGPITLRIRFLRGEEHCFVSSNPGNAFRKHQGRSSASLPFVFSLPLYSPATSSIQQMGLTRQDIGLSVSIDGERFEGELGGWAGVEHA